MIRLISSIRGALVAGIVAVATLAAVVLGAGRRAKKGARDELRIELVEQDRETALRISGAVRGVDHPDDDRLRADRRGYRDGP